MYKLYFTDRLFEWNLSKNYQVIRWNIELNPMTTSVEEFHRALSLVSDD